MVSLVTQSFTFPTLYVGLGGNHYVVCDSKESLVSLCEKIDKSPNSIYYNSKYGCWTIRIKSNSTKKKLLTVI